ncbi:MAG: chromosome segregation protein SMC [Myxococcales bacterium]|nr:chromosome segregation protein SMC [Myxococcales bacterium]
MYLLELAVQGVRGFSPTSRIPLKPGYTALLPPGKGELPPLCGMVVSMFFSDGRGGDIVYMAQGQKVARAGITVFGDDQSTYRLVRELGTAGVLHRLNRGSKQFEILSQDLTEIGQFLRSQVGAPTKTALEQLFCFTAAQLPTRRPKTKASVTSKPSLAPVQLPQAEPVSGDLPTLKTRLSELEREHALSKEVDELQFKQDGIASQLFELEGKLKGSDGLKAAVKEAEAAAAAAPTAESLKVPKDIVARAERYPMLQQKRDEALARLDREREQGAEQAEPSYVEPLYRNASFWASVAAGLVLLVLGSQLSGYLRYVALLDIPAFGFAALLALRYLEELQAGSKVSHRGGFLAAREKRIREDFEGEVAEVRAAMTVAGVETVQELIEGLSRRGLLLEKAAELRRQLEALEKEPDYASAASRYQQLKAEQDQINARLLEKGGYVRDVREVEREIARTKEAIAKLRSPQPAAPVAGPAPSGSSPLQEDPSPQLLSLAAELFGCDLPAAAQLATDRCGQYLVALTDRRYQAVELDGGGNACVVASGRKLAAGELPGKDLDLLYLSLRLALVEKFSARQKVPMLIEDGLVCVEESKHSLLGRMLKHLGTLTQVLHLAPGRGAAESADSVVNV